jgi:uncharacterized protein (DUF58 family)
MAGFAFENFFLIYLAVILLFSTIISLPSFHLGMNIQDLIVTRDLEKTKIFQDDFVHVKVNIENKGKNKFEFIEIRDYYNPELFHLVLGENFISTRIDPKEKISFSYILQPRVRGEYPFGPLSVIIKDRLGFNSEERIVPNSVTQILIYPPYEDIKRIEILGSKRVLNLNYGVQRSKMKGLGSEFYGMRKYVFGDQFRLIDWKSSVRHQKLIVKEFESERDVSVMIMIDCGESMAGGSIENTKFEYAIRAAMLLTKISLTRRDSVGVFMFSDKKNYHFMEPNAGSDHFYQVLDFVARVKPSGRSKLEDAMDYITKRFQKRSLVFLISDLEQPSEDIIKGIKKIVMWKHSLVVISPFSPWFEIHEVDLAPSDKALAEAISEEMMEHILKVKQSVRSFAVPIISVGPDDMMHAILSEYLEAKKKGKAF